METSNDKPVNGFFIQICGKTPYEKHALRGTVVEVGRNSLADIHIEHPNVSRRHCVLTYSNEGWKVKDCQSQNGTFMNGKKLEADTSYVLKNGDLIFLGPPSENPYGYRFQDSDDVEEPDVMTLSSEDEEEVKPFGTRVTALATKMKNGNSGQPKKRTKNQAPESFVNSSDCIILSPPKNQPKKARTIIDIFISDEDPPSQVLKSSQNRKNKVQKGNKLQNKPKLPDKSSNQALSCLPSSSGIDQGTSSDQRITDLLDQYFDKESQSSEIVNVENVDSACCVDISSEISFSDLDKEYPLESGTHGLSRALSRKIETLVDELCNLRSELKNYQYMLETGITSRANEGEPEKGIKDIEDKIHCLTEQIAELEEKKSDLIKQFRVVVAEKDKLLKLQLEQKRIINEEKDKLKSEIIENFEQQFVCNICTEILIKPMVLGCSHTFCEYCIIEWKKKKNQCPICRATITSQNRILVLDQYIDKTLETVTPEEKEKRNAIIAERESKKVAQNAQNKRAVRPKRRSRGNSIRNRIVTSTPRPAVFSFNPGVIQLYQLLHRS